MRQGCQGTHRHTETSHFGLRPLYPARSCSELSKMFRQADIPHTPQLLPHLLQCKPSRNNDSKFLCHFCIVQASLHSVSSGSKFICIAVAASKGHRMMESQNGLGLEGTLKMMQIQHLSLVAQITIQPGLEPPQRWGIPQLLWTSCARTSHLSQKGISSQDEVLPPTGTGTLLVTCCLLLFYMWRGGRNYAKAKNNRVHQPSKLLRFIFFITSQATVSGSI